MRKVKVSCYPYEADDRLYYRSNLEFNEGLTVLVGCNGSGKSTLLTLLKDVLNKEKVPTLYYDNLRAPEETKQRALMSGDMAYAATSMASSEGENIVMSLGNFAKVMGSFIRNGGKQSGNELARVFQGVQGQAKKEDKAAEAEEFWFLFDAVDSGLSIDNVEDLKWLFNKVIEDVHAMGKRIYILVAANAYELCRKEQCFDVRGSKYVTFKDYEEYRTFVLKSRESKDKRFNN